MEMTNSQACVERQYDSMKAEPGLQSLLCTSCALYKQCWGASNLYVHLLVLDSNVHQA